MGERLPNHIVRLAVMDLLSAVLRELRFESAGYRWLELGAPFRLCFDTPGLRGVHLVASGECELVLHDGSVEQLTAGELVIFPRGDSHVLRSPGAGAGPTVSDGELAARTPDTRLRAGAPRADVVVVCGAFLVGEPDHPVLRGLPHYIHLPGDAGQPLPWLAPLVEALRTEAFDGGPGSDLVMARLSDALLIGLSRAAFAARFTDRVGEPAMRYLLSLRMQRAKSLLRNRETTINAVAIQVGYQSDVAFAAAFKREVGSSPGAYRRAAVS